MTQETIKALSDAELSQVLAWGQQEQSTRILKRKQEAISKIKALAETSGISITINKVRGRPKRPIK